MSSPETNRPGTVTSTLTTPLARLRFPFLCIVVYWAVTLAQQVIDKPYFIGFMLSMATSGLFTLLFLGWWLINKEVSKRDKLAGFVFILAEAIITGKLAHKSVTAITLWSVGLPLVATALISLIYLSKKYLFPLRTTIALCVTVIWAVFLTFRNEGLDSTLSANLHWRWTPSAEQRFLSEQVVSKTKTPLATASYEGGPGMDWPEFRGTNRDGVIHGTRISTNWSSKLPTVVWKRKVGPAWSSMIIVEGMLYTQEQRADNEVTVAYDAQTGGQIWVHEEGARFEEAVSGPGPRATPTWKSGRLYSLGGSGILTCLTATNGQLIWKADIKKDSGAPPPLWAFSSTPLIMGNKVIVYAGGPANKAILGYSLDSGILSWSTPGGQNSYSSAQEVTIDGVPQCVMLHDSGLTSLNPETGKVLWESGTTWKGAPRCGQPHLIDGNSLVVGAMDGMGTSRIKVTRSGDAWTVTPTWITKDLKPEFPDFVISGGFAYGFDVSMFTCINLSDGKRAWKEGRYGRGQVMLLEDQQLLLITSETGELVLLALDPAQHRELGRFQAIEGKTWAHALVQNNLIYLRNSEEMACYRAEK